jgi:hypothetical protein
LYLNDLLDRVDRVDNHVLEEFRMLEDCCGTLKCLVLYCNFVTVDAQVLRHLEGAVQGLGNEVSVGLSVELFGDI